MLLWQNRSTFYRFTGFGAQRHCARLVVSKKFLEEKFFTSWCLIVKIVKISHYMISHVDHCRPFTCKASLIPEEVGHGWPLLIKKYLGSSLIEISIATDKLSELFSGFSVGCCINRKVICLENNLLTSQLNAPGVIRAKKVTDDDRSIQSKHWQAELTLVTDTHITFLSLLAFSSTFQETDNPST